MPARVEQFGYREELKRTLSTADLVIYGMIFMVPIAPYSVFGYIWIEAKGMVPLAYLLGLIGMFFTAMSYAAMSRVYPLAGSVYAYVQHGLAEVTGFFAGWLITLDYILAPALLYLFSVVALRPIFPGVPAHIWLVGFVLVNLLANLIGMQVTAHVNRAMLLMELLVLAAFIVLGLIKLYSGAGSTGLTLRPVYDPNGVSLATIAAATSIAVLSFLGFDGISTLSEENVGKQGSVALATLLALLITGVLFMLQTWIATDLAQGMQFASADTAFYEIAERAGGPYLRLVTILAIVLAYAIANAMAAQAAVARVIFAMARDGKLPAILSQVHPRFKTPYISTILVAVVSLGVGLMFAARVDDLSRIVNFGALSSFILLHLSVINHFCIRQGSRRWLLHLCFPLIGIIILSYVLYEMDRSAKVLGGIWIAIGALIYAYLAYRSRARRSSSV